MGHRDGSQADVYATAEFPSAVIALTNTFCDLQQLAPGALHRISTEETDAKAEPGVKMCS